MAHIRLRNVSLRYPVYTTRARSLRQTLFSRLGGTLAPNKNIMVVEALREINLELVDGDRVGIVGHNGAGKTTLLRTLARIYEPQDGQVEVEGTISCFVDITLGMDSEATGWENIVFRGAFLGLTFSQARELSPSIAEFSELGSFLDMPIRTYSSGMYMRLAFAVSTAVISDILIMDEMIGVGDARFLDKADKRMSNVIDRAKIMVIATHSIPILSRFCNKLVWLEKGQIKAFGPLHEVLPGFQSDRTQLAGT